MGYKSWWFQVNEVIEHVSCKGAIEVEKYSEVLAGQGIQEQDAMVRVCYLPRWL